MGNRSKYVAVGSAMVGVAGVRAVARRRRRHRLARAAEGFVDSVMPSINRDAPDKAVPPAADEAHAPGHQHLLLTPEELEQRAPATEYEPPFAKHRQGLRHPGKG